MNIIITVIVIVLVIILIGVCLGLLFIAYLAIEWRIRRQVLGRLYAWFIMGKNKSYKNVPNAYLYWVLVNGNKHMRINALEVLTERLDTIGENILGTLSRITDNIAIYEINERQLFKNFETKAFTAYTNRSARNEKARDEFFGKYYRMWVIRFGTPKQREELGL